MYKRKFPQSRPILLIEFIIEFLIWGIAKFGNMYQKEIDSADLLRSDSFQGFKPPSARGDGFYGSDNSFDQDRVDDSSRASTSSSVWDEEHWDWPVLLTRILCFILLFAFLVFLVIGKKSYNSSTI